MGSNIKGPWQPGHKRESFHWSIIYTVVQTLWTAVARKQGFLGKLKHLVNYNI